MITFDWTQITWIGNPLVVPWWAEVNYMIGFVLFYWILAPIFYYTNVSAPLIWNHVLMLVRSGIPRIFRSMSATLPIVTVPLTISSPSLRPTLLSI